MSLRARLVVGAALAAQNPVPQFVRGSSGIGWDYAANRAGLRHRYEKTASQVSRTSSLMPPARWRSCRSLTTRSSIVWSGKPAA